MSLDQKLQLASDIIQAIGGLVLLATLIVIIVYTRETRKLRIQAESQSKISEAQLRHISEHAKIEFAPYLEVKVLRGEELLGSAYSYSYSCSIRNHTDRMAHHLAVFIKSERGYFWGGAYEVLSEGRRREDGAYGFNVLSGSGPDQIISWINMRYGPAGIALFDRLHTVKSLFSKDDIPFIAVLFYDLRGHIFGLKRGFETNERGEIGSLRPSQLLTAG